MNVKFTATKFVSTCIPDLARTLQSSGEETLVKVVNGSTSHTSSAMTMSSLAQLLDNYIHTVKQRHITAKHKPACV